MSMTLVSPKLYEPCPVCGDRKVWPPCAFCDD